MATIKAIESRSIHQIQSGQVIVDLCSVVKELVENSLDAGAGSVEVRFKNQGLDAIEVQDNGDGISKNNYETLALKHHTSKLSTYDDLTTLQTFGFRGEALSSLCALSKFSVITCTAEDAPKGTKLEFEVSGKLKSTSVIAAQKGTTVIVENLFNNLPVRRRELERNIKREWNKVMGHLGQYACIQTGIKFSVTQQAGKGSKTTVFSTKGNPTTRENIINVFGAKTLVALIPMDLKLELEPTSGSSQRWSTQDDGGMKEIRIVGHISRPAYGEGRQTPDRQMFFVNSRPCGLPQVAKAFNEVYKSYNGSQSPFIFANIELDTHMYDVNVSPDKRTILLHDQNKMLENLKEALTALFESQDYTVPISQLPAQKQPAYKQLTISRDSAKPNSSPYLKTPRASRTPVDAAENENPGKLSSVSSREETTESEDKETIFSWQVRDSVSLEPRTRAVSRESMKEDGASVSLISNWLGRNTEDRGEEKVARDPVVSERKSHEGLSKDKLRLIGKMSKEGQRDQSHDAPDEPSSLTPDSPTLFVSDSREPSIERQQIGGLRVTDKSSEPPIPSFQSPLKPTPSIADKFSSTARSFRAPAEIATITIGDRTVTSFIGSPLSKRSKPNNFAQGMGKSNAPAKKVSSFGSILSQKFAAPGSSTQAMEVDDDIEDDEDQSESRHASSAMENSPEESGNAESGQDEDEKMHDISPTIVKEGNTQEVEDDTEYIDEDEKKAAEDAKVQTLIYEAENSAAMPSQENLNRAKGLLKGGTRKKDSTVNLLRKLETSVSSVEQNFLALNEKLAAYQTTSIVKSEEDDGVEASNAEEKLSLTISKTDFAKMRIVGQFNLGFILATRTADPASSDETEDGAKARGGDDLFIIDQHASDEKYNFERLQATTIVQSQRLVLPKTLDLTAMEEEIVIENLDALEANGFLVSIDTSGASAIGHRCSLLALPLSKEVAFSLKDLEELIALLAEQQGMGKMVGGGGVGGVVRPSRVRKMFAMRACRSSVMIGKSLTVRQMRGLVGRLGGLDKPWNCPHGRPTMRHVCGLGAWDGRDEEGEVDGGGEGRLGMGLGTWMRGIREAGEGEDGEGDGGGEGDDEVDEMDEDEMNANMYSAFSSAMEQPNPEASDEEEEEEDDDSEEEEAEGNEENDEEEKEEEL